MDGDAVPIELDDGSILNVPKTILRQQAPVMAISARTTDIVMKGLEIKFADEKSSGRLFKLSGVWIENNPPQFECYCVCDSIVNCRWVAHPFGLR